MNKTITKNFGDKVKDVIFPYSDSDKDRLPSAFLLLKFDSYEEAKLAAKAL
jgi:hypothetical protein